MSQVDVPAISLQRYLELLKRRRWQVIPVSLFGLLVGGLVAFFIPRYYVADTLLVHQMVPGQKESRSVEDPFRSIVDTARMTIPLAVGEAMKNLRWEEAMVADPYERTQNERGVISRVTVYDTNQYLPDRDYAQIRVTYKDRDGERSSAFLNELIDTWIEKRLTELKAPAEEARATASEAVNRQRALYDQLLAEKAGLEIEYQIDPAVDVALQRTQLRQEEQKSLRDKRDETARARAVQKDLLQADRERLTRTERRIKQDAAVLLDEARKSPEGRLITQQLQYYREQMENFIEGTDQHATAKRQIPLLEKKLLELVGQGSADAEGMVENPEYGRLVAKIAEREETVAGLDTEFAQLEAQVVAQGARIVRLAEGLGIYEKKLFAFNEAKRNLERAYDDLRQADSVLAKLGSQQTVRQVAKANPPPRPTEPNILVVALIGCVLGLGFAISLILLLDLLQGTFKTVDDVERGLPVPVLGGMSHLETEVERVDAGRRRRRVSLVSAAFVALVVAVVTIFYVDPTRLPPVVRDLLALLLGA